MTSPSALSLAALTTPALSPDSALRLVAAGSDVQLLISMPPKSAAKPLEPNETAIVSVSLASPGTPRPRLVLGQRLPVVPAWDARVVDGALEVLYEVAGGATYRLERAREGGKPVPAFVAPLASIGRPRFVDGAPSRGWLSAIVDSTKLALLQAQAPVSTPSEADRLPRSPSLPVVANALDGVVVRSGTRGAAFVKVFRSGPVRAGSIMRGALHQVALDQQMRPVGDPQPLLADTTIFELDAAATESAVAVFVTTERGAILLQGRFGTRGLELAPPVVDEGAGELTSPSVAIVGNTIHLAAIRDAARSPKPVVGQASLGGRVT